MKSFEDWINESSRESKLNNKVQSSLADFEISTYPYKWIRNEDDTISIDYSYEYKQFVSVSSYHSTALNILNLDTPIPYKIRVDEFDTINIKNSDLDIIDNLPDNLEILTIEDCKLLKTVVLPESIKTLHIKKSPVVKIKNLEKCKKLLWLEIYLCHDIKSLNIANNDKTEITVEKCARIDTIKFTNSKEIKSISLWGLALKSIHLPEHAHLIELNTCEELVSISGLKKCNFIKILNCPISIEQPKIEITSDFILQRTSHKNEDGTFHSPDSNLYDVKDELGTKNDDIFVTWMNSGMNWESFKKTSSYRGRITGNKFNV